MDKRTSKFNSQILEEATAWFVDFNEEEVGPAGRKGFNAWLRRSPEHVRAFLEISAFWEDASAFGKRAELDIQDIIARAKTEHNVHPLELGARQHAPEKIAGARARPRRFRLLAMAASIVVSLSMGAFGWHAFLSAPTYATQIGEQRSITLEDGSSVELNSRSRIKVRFTQAERSVELLEGQALFSVAKNPARPFIVATGDTRVRAVGTRFDVYRKSAGTVVTVIEGRVAVAPTDASQRVTAAKVGAQHDPSARRDSGVKPEEVLLAAGEQLMITPLAIELPKPTNIAAVTAWTDKRLVFDSTPLREVVEEFNRHNRQQLVIRDPELYDFHISGAFPSTDSSRMIEFLRQRFGVTMDRSRDEIEISHREAAELDPHGL